MNSWAESLNQPDTVKEGDSKENAIKEESLRFFYADRSSRLWKQTRGLPVLEDTALHLAHLRYFIGCVCSLYTVGTGIHLFSINCCNHLHLKN